MNLWILFFEYSFKTTEKLINYEFKLNERIVKIKEIFAEMKRILDLFYSKKKDLTYVLSKKGESAYEKLDTTLFLTCK